MKKILLGILVIVLMREVKAQSNDLPGEPVVGRSCPDFLLKKVDFFRKNTVSLKDFKGKWLILEFWAKNCSSCIANFPNVSKEQIKFKDSVQFLMITYEDKGNVNREIYSDYHKKLNLEMPCAFDDTAQTLFKQFNVGLLPHSIIVDPNGIVRVVTAKVSEAKLQALLDGKNPIFSEASYYNDKEKANNFKYDDSAPFLINGNGGNDTAFLFRSLLSKWTVRMPFRPNSRFTERIYEGLGMDLASLYRVAYFGKFKFYREDSVLYGKVWPNPILETKDTGLFKPDYASGSGLFCYSLIVSPSKASKEYIMRIMRSDLHRYFDYEVSIEIRKLPCWKLVATDGARIKLKTRGGPIIRSDNGKPWREYSLRNAPMSNLLSLVEGYSGVTNNGAPLFDETGITSNIDIDLDVIRNDYDVMRKTLTKNGLDLIPGEVNMKVLVIRSPDVEVQSSNLE